MSPGKRKAARRLLDSWINDIYVRAGSCLQRSRPPCSAGEKRARPADGANLPQDAAGCGAPANGVPGTRPGITDLVGPRGASADPTAVLPGASSLPGGARLPGAGRLRAEPAVGLPGACTGSPASPAPKARCRAVSICPAECPGSPASCSGLPPEPSSVRCPVYSTLNECGSGERASPPVRHPLVLSPDLFLGAGVRNGCVPAGRGPGGGGRLRLGPMPTLRCSCWSGLREGGPVPPSGAHLSAVHPAPPRLDS